MIKINKDIVFWTICIIWLALNVSSLLTDKIDVSVNNNVFILIFCFLIILKKTNNRFNNWLNKKI